MDLSISLSNTEETCCGSYLCAIIGTLCTRTSNKEKGERRMWFCVYQLKCPPFKWLLAFKYSKGCLFSNTKKEAPARTPPHTQVRLAWVVVLRAINACAVATIYQRIPQQVSYPWLQAFLAGACGLLVSATGVF